MVKKTACGWARALILTLYMVSLADVTLTCLGHDLLSSIVVFFSFSFGGVCVACASADDRPHPVHLGPFSC